MLGFIKKYARALSAAVIGLAGITAVIVEALGDESTWVAEDRSTSVGLTVLAAVAAIAAIWILTSEGLLVQAGGALVLAESIGLWITRHWGTLGVTWALSVTPIVTFVALLVTQRGNTQAPAVITTAMMRNAIAGSFVLTYLVSVAFVLFYNDKHEVPEGVTKLLVQNFTVLLGVIIAFYFGTTTREKVVTLRAMKDVGATAAEVQAVADS